MKSKGKMQYPQMKPCRVSPRVGLQWNGFGNFPLPAPVERKVTSVKSMIQLFFFLCYSLFFQNPILRWKNNEVHINGFAAWKNDILKCVYKITRYVAFLE
ncbi:hypothetical protein CDAR_9791 [Caerostris darwini]|uniref:Uncharacterized protein n=1 Tax=Caerostris darwini TaxID=1538125 RepID=A0AAV4URK4_9ARAC|nr:hypothetical protein CDAR_9791 [Caerostris darwini]